MNGKLRDWINQYYGIKAMRLASLAIGTEKSGDSNEIRKQLALDIQDWVDGIDAIYSELDQGNPAKERALEVLLECT